MTKHVPFPKSLQQLLQRILEAIDQAGGCMTRVQLATTLHDARPLDIDVLETALDARAAGLPAPLLRLLMQCDGALSEARNHLTP